MKTTMNALVGLAATLAATVTADFTIQAWSGDDCSGDQVLYDVKFETCWPTYDSNSYRLYDISDAALNEQFIIFAPNACPFDSTDSYNDVLTTGCAYAPQSLSDSNYVGAESSCWPADKVTTRGSVGKALDSNVDASGYCSVLAGGG
ncbi:hypothetical protein LTR09_009766 [Extremus antarcticus]|uniref:Uncharacterized protein n=1 Tax=Extremus antarcticus TaxID=702011 RepID=A0AAJ0DES7_9PEZI|nr:hypothetical protein LTR09_009766 [Extremus antarcticus]